MDPLRDGVRLFSRGVRRGNGLITFVGALVLARGLLRWLDGPQEQRVFSGRVKPGEELTIAVTRPGR